MYTKKNFNIQIFNIEINIIIKLPPISIICVQILN